MDPDILLKSGRPVQLTRTTADLSSHLYLRQTRSFDADQGRAESLRPTDCQPNLAHPADYTAMSLYGAGRAQAGRYRSPGPSLKLPHFLNVKKTADAVSVMLTWFVVSVRVSV
jgi:hypothetical protein